MTVFPRLVTLAVCLAAAPAAAAQTPADTIVISSKILSRERTAFVSVPASHAVTRRTYPIVVVLDGEYNFTHARTVAGTLASLGHFPEAIVVAVPNASSSYEDRVHDMTPPGLSVSGSSRNEGGDRFLDFIEKELLTSVRERYGGGNPVIFVGHSSGAVIATYAAATRPASFPVVIAIDAPIHLDDHWLATQLTRAARSQSATSPIRLARNTLRLDRQHVGRAECRRGIRSLRCTRGRVQNRAATAGAGTATADRRSAHRKEHGVGAPLVQVADRGLRTAAQ